MSNKGVLLLFVVGLVIASGAGFIFLQGGEDVPSESRASTPQTTEQPYKYGTEYHPEDPGEKVQTVEYKTINMNESVNYTYNTTRIEMAVFEEVNEIRSEHGLSEWDYSYRLASVARSHSSDMVENDYLEHENKAGQMPWDRWREMDTERCMWYGENIVQTTLDQPSGDLTANETTADSMVDAWMGSETHRELILSEHSDYNYVGVGTYFIADSTQPATYGTMNVCGPEDPDAPFESAAS